MIRIWNKYLLVNNNYFIRIDKKGKFTFKKVFGKKVRIDGDLDLFLHKVRVRGKVFYTVSEATSGCRVAKLHKNPKKAIDKAKQIYDDKGENLIKVKSDRMVKQSSLSPRFRFIVNPTRQKRCGNLTK